MTQETESRQYWLEYWEPQGLKGLGTSVQLNSAHAY